MSERYCAYCRCYRSGEGFKLMRHDSSGTQRSMCPPCQRKRQRPQAELQALADRDRAERKKGSR